MDEVLEHEETPRLTADRYAKVKGEASRLKTQASEKARSAAEEGKTKAAETLGSVSQATRDAADRMRGSDADALSGLVASAADSIEDFAQRIREKSVDEMIDDAREMVRRSPVLVIAIAAVAGFMLTRFLKATPGNGE